MSIRSLSTSTLTQQKRYPTMSASDRLASGGNYEGESGGYYYHIFTTSGTLQVGRAGACEVMLIAGGGGGGGVGLDSSGGGGAGGFILKPLELSAGAKSVVIGDGGANGGNNLNTAGSSGSDSTFAGLTAKGGGGGGSENTNNAQTGGSGGGGGENGGTSLSGAAPLGEETAGLGTYDGIGEQGHRGGSGSVGNNQSGAGGGAGGPGHAAATAGDWMVDAITSDNFGDRAVGGIGARIDGWGADMETVAGTAIADGRTWTGIDAVNYTGYWIASGGSGANDGTTAVVPAAPGGGGAGASTTTAGANGTDGTGGGGGGGANNNVGGDGGSGLCVVRYKV